MNRTLTALAFLAFTVPALAHDPEQPIDTQSAVPRTDGALSYAAIDPVHKSVNLKRLDPVLRAVLERASQHFGKTVKVTSGYRSPSYNRKVHGARKSKHITGQAADIQIPGVSKARLARWAKAQPEIGGVGRYCRSNFVHIDTAGDRTWYWPCRKKRRG